MSKTCGYIALLGCPNAGKSTLLNACLGQKIVGVSKRPQTTRNRILGIDTQGDSQFIFLDTPGMHKAQGLTKMNHVMNSVAWSVAAEADIVCYLVDSSLGWKEEDQQYLANLLKHVKTPIIVLASKVDSSKKDLINKNITIMTSKIEELNAQIANPDERTKIPAPFAVSAKRKEELESFKKLIQTFLPEGPWLYDSEEVTDKPEKFLLSELIREQLFRHLGDELPYGCGVQIESLKKDKKLVSVSATVIVSRKAHKPIVIGKNASLLKMIGTKSRLSLEDHFQKKVFLDLYVKVDTDWINNSDLIASIQGLEKE